jgi:hypothetical protein
VLPAGRTFKKKAADTAAIAKLRRHLLSTCSASTRRVIAPKHFFATFPIAHKFPLQSHTRSHHNLRLAEPHGLVLTLARVSIHEKRWTEF